MLVDDGVQDKRYSQFIELVKLQHSDAEHGLVRGIVNLVHSAGKKQSFYPIGYRIYDSLTKMVRPRTSISLKWSSMSCLPRESRQKVSCSIVGVPPLRTRSWFTV
jgi:hypothetical protein